MLEKNKSLDKEDIFIRGNDKVSAGIRAVKEKVWERTDGL